LTDSKNSTKSGKYLEVLGNYDARRGEKSEFKAERISYWMGQGAQVSPTVHNLLIDKKIVSGKKVNKLPSKQVIKKDLPAQAGGADAPAEAAAAEAAPAAEEAPAAEAEVAA
jgi:small subunit ribosomal protein S16